MYIHKTTRMYIGTGAVGIFVLAGIALATFSDDIQK